MVYREKKNRKKLFRFISRFTANEKNALRQVFVFCFVKQILLSVTVYDLGTAKLAQRVFLTNALVPGERQFRLLTYES